MKSAKFFIAFTFLLAFVFQVSAQKNTYPNELKNYLFYKDKRLQSLKHGISDKSTIAKSFGADCENQCDYDKNWTVKFEYFDEETEPPNEFLQSDLDADPKYTGKLFSIILSPKSDVSFDDAVLSERFNSLGGIGMTAVGSDGKTDYVSRRYRDSYGLEYKISYETPLTSDNKEILEKRKTSLESIEYGLSDVLVKKMFIKTK